MNQEKKQGFTLVEIMIVVAALGLIAAIGIPSMLNAMSTSRTKSMERNIADVMQAKGMTMLPRDMGGDNATNGQDVSESVFSRTAGITSVADLKVGDHNIDIGVIGTPPSYD